jgi:hypothetical protein
VFQCRVAEEAPTGAGIDDADPVVLNAEPAPGGGFVPAQHDHRSRTHMLFFADHFGDALATVIVQGFGGELQPVGSALVSGGAIVGGK